MTRVLDNSNVTRMDWGEIVELVRLPSAQRFLPEKGRLDHVRRSRRTWRFAQFYTVQSSKPKFHKLSQSGITRCGWGKQACTSLNQVGSLSLARQERRRVLGRFQLVYRCFALLKRTTISYYYPSAPLEDEISRNFSAHLLCGVFGMSLFIGRTGILLPRYRLFESDPSSPDNDPTVRDASASSQITRYAYLEE